MDAFIARLDRLQLETDALRRDVSLLRAAIEGLDTAVAEWRRAQPAIVGVESQRAARMALGPLDVEELANNPELDL